MRACMCAQVRPMAHMQLQVEKQMRKKTSPIAEIVSHRPILSCSSLSQACPNICGRLYSRLFSSYILPLCVILSQPSNHHLYYYRSAVLTNLSSKFDRFLAVRSKFDTVHSVDFYAPTCCLSATFVRPLFAFVLCFLRQKILNNFAFRHRCDF